MAPPPTSRPRGDQQIGKPGADVISQCIVILVVSDRAMASVGMDHLDIRFGLIDVVDAGRPHGAGSHLRHREFTGPTHFASPTTRE